MREAADAERDAVASAVRQAQVKRARAADEAELEAVELGAGGGPGASERGRKAARHAIVCGHRQAVVGLGWAGARWLAVADRERGLGEGLPSPEVLRRLQKEEERRKGVSYILKPEVARRLLALIMERRRAKTRKRERGRVLKTRVALLSRFERLT